MNSSITDPVVPERKIIMIEMDSASLLHLYVAAWRYYDFIYERFGLRPKNLDEAIKELAEELLRHGIDHDTAIREVTRGEK